MVWRKFMSTTPEQSNNPEQNRDEAISRYTDRRSILDDLMGMDEVPSAKSPTHSGNQENGKQDDDADGETVVYGYDFIQEKLKESGLNIGDELDGATEAMLPIKDTEGFHIAIMVPGQRVQPFLWPDDTETVTIGRDKVSADICINDNRVSRVHLQIKRIDDNTLEVMDLGSTNHSYMSQDALKPYTPTSWAFGEIIVVGRTRLVLRRGVPHT